MVCTAEAFNINLLNKCLFGLIQANTNNKSNGYYTSVIQIKNPPALYSRSSWTFATARNPLWRLEGAYRPSSNFKYSIPTKEVLSPNKSLAPRCRRGAVEGFVRVLSRFVLHCAFLVPGGAVACRGQATPGHPTDPSCLNNT